MLRALGIISEYDPFHNGHAYLLKSALRQTGADVSVAVMSGNWVQRGEPALFDKWSRSEAAIKGGINLVVELPFFSAVQPSHLFSQGAVRLVAGLKCHWLCFGAENPQFDYQKLIANQPNKSSEFKRFDQPYASIFQDYLKRRTGISLNQPNDILAFGYANANNNIGSPLELVPIKRVGQDHNDSSLDLNSNIASGGTIRSAIIKKDLLDVKKLVPQTSVKMIEEADQFTWHYFWPLLRYELIETPISELHRIYQMTEGIEYRLKKAAENAATFSDFLHLVKTKRYTFTRIQRLCCYVLVHAYEDDMQVLPSYVRVLAFDNLGQMYLNQVKGSLDFPLVTKVTDEIAKKELKLDVKAGMLFQMVNNQSQDFYKHPLILSRKTP